MSLRQLPNLLCVLRMLLVYPVAHGILTGAYESVLALMQDVTKAPPVMLRRPSPWRPTPMPPLLSTTGSTIVGPVMTTVEPTPSTLTVPKLPGSRPMFIPGLTYSELLISMRPPLTTSMKPRPKLPRPAVRKPPVGAPG